MAPAARDLFARIDELEQELKSLATAGLDDEIARLKLLDITRKAARLIERPNETIMRMYLEPHQCACLRASLEMGLVEPVVAGPKTATQLASITGCDKRLIVRILRPLCCLGIFSEEGFETYGPTEITRSLSAPGIGRGFKFMYDQCIASACHLPEYLAKSEFKEPEAEGCFKSAFNTELDFFPWLMEHPKQLSNFNDCMAAQYLTRAGWFNLCSVQKLLMNEYKGGNEPLIVDIGGNRGHDLQRLRDLFPETRGKGRLILQDQPHVLADIHDLDEDIVRMEYDFFTPQPIKGARAYYMHRILHDFSDAKCQEILKNVVGAMVPGYSKLILHELVLRDVGAALFPSLIDVNMMAVLSGMVRTERQWTTLLDSVGLEIWTIHICDDGTEGLIEAVLKS